MAVRDLPNLDLLRTIAVLSVVLEHLLLAYKVQRIGTWQVAWIGVVGVFFFFVHTTTVLMWSLERRPHTLDFYIRRIFRVYPLALFVLAVTLLVHAPVSGTPAQYFHFAPAPSWHLLPYTFSLMPNLHSAIYQPVSVMWSLPYEIEMYFVLPMLFFFLQRNLSLWPLLLLWGFAVKLCQPLFPEATHNFFLCIPYFLPGAMAYVGFSRYRARLSAWLLPVFFAVLWALFMHNPGWRQADGLCLALGLALPFFHQFRTPWLLSASRHVARVSYSTYLLHPFAIVLGLYLLPHRPLAVQLAVIAGTTIGGSIAGYHLLERPMIRLGSRLANLAERRYEQKSLGALRIPEAEIS